MVLAAERKEPDSDSGALRCSPSLALPVAYPRTGKSLTSIDVLSTIKIAQSDLDTVGYPQISTGADELFAKRRRSTELVYTIFLLPFASLCPPSHLDGLSA